MQKIIKLQINKTKSKTNYIPSIPLNKIIELSEYQEKTWQYNRKSNELHLITYTKEKTTPTIEIEAHIQKTEPITETSPQENQKTSNSNKKKQKSKKQTRRERKKTK